MGAERDKSGDLVVLQIEKFPIDRNFRTSQCLVLSVQDLADHTQSRCIMLFRAATNVRTFEYYSFEIFTNELFLRTNVR